jgi:hypothetical protein
VTGSLVRHLAVLAATARRRAARARRAASFGPIGRAIAGAMPSAGERLPIAGRWTNVGERSDERRGKRNPGAGERGARRVPGKEPFEIRPTPWPRTTAAVTRFSVSDLSRRVARRVVPRGVLRWVVLHREAVAARRCPPSRGAPSFDPAPVHLDQASPCGTLGVSGCWPRHAGAA